MELWLSQLMLGTVLSAVGGTAELAHREADWWQLADLIHLRQRPSPTSLSGLKRFAP